MEDRLVSFETAKLAKEKGFDNKNSPQYIQYDYGDNGWKEKTNQEYEDLDYSIGIGDKIRISRPTQSLLQKWLRDVHNIHIQNHFLNEKYAIKIKYNINISTNIYNKNTYEEALEAGLQLALKLINNEPK